MMNNKVRAIIIFALISVFAGNTLATESMKLSENDTGKTVEMKCGDQFEVELPGNPTTGYVWDTSSLDSTVLRLAKTDFTINERTIGSGGVEVMKFQATAVGTSVLKLKFHRPFEHNIPPIKTFEITVVITK
jgi:inhibitor of cysteine peptidase